jgi:hypothetical protein
MNKKIFIRSLLLTIVILVAIVIYIDSGLNRDDKNFKTKLKSINASDLRHLKNDYVVIIFSANCPSAPIYTPEIKRNLDIFKNNNFESFLIVDDAENEESEKTIEQYKNNYKIHDVIYRMDKNTYPINGGFLNAKRRYVHFVKDLAPNSASQFWGYAYYIIFKNGEYYNAVYNLTEKDIK